MDTSLEFELSNSREVSANFVKLADIKEKHTEYALFGSTNTIGIYLIYTLNSVKSVFASDCGSRLVSNELVGRINSLSPYEWDSKYSKETMGYLECHLHKERVLDKILIVTRGNEQDLIEYAHEKARIISMISGVKVEVL